MIPFPNKKYSVIYADPPWSYQDKRCNGNAADHYSTMRIEAVFDESIKGENNDGARSDSTN